MHERTSNIIIKDSLRMACLHAAKSICLPNWYIGAGFVRNAIWDYLHDRYTFTPIQSIDLVYFDNSEVAPEKDKGLEYNLSLKVPEVKWRVRNQARMHHKYGFKPFRNTIHGIAHWIELQTCVGVHLGLQGELSYVAPFGLHENWSLNLNPNPIANYPLSLYRRRIREKSWLTQWPLLRVYES